jgi:hypothetical protein
VRIPFAESELPPTTVFVLNKLHKDQAHGTSDGKREQSQLNPDLFFYGEAHSTQSKARELIACSNSVVTALHVTIILSEDAIAVTPEQEPE